MIRPSALIWAKVNAEPDRMHREQRGDSRAPHVIRGGCLSPPRPADRALSSGTSPASEATIPAASSSRSSTAGTLRSLPVTPLATIDASRMTRPAHTNSAKAAPRAPQRRITSCVSGYPQALSPRTAAPIVRLIYSPTFFTTALPSMTISPRWFHAVVRSLMILFSSRLSVTVTTTLTVSPILTGAAKFRSWPR